MKSRRTCLILVMLWAVLLALPSAYAQSSFSYKGTLPGSPTGTYDLDFWLYNAASGGAQIGSLLSINSVSVNTGNYTFTLDFGAASFQDSPLYLVIAYRVHGTSTYTTLPNRIQEGARFASVANSAQGLQGHSVSSAAPASGQVLKWNGLAWVPAADSVGFYSAGSGLSLAGTVFSIASGGVVATMLANNSVTTNAIANGAVTSTKIANGAVTTAAIASGAVSNGALASGAVTSAKIANGAVTTATIASAAVTTATLASLAVTTGAIADGAVTAAKVAVPLQLTNSVLGDAFSMRHTGSGDAVSGYATTGRALYGSSSAGMGASITGGGGDGAYISGTNNGVTASTSNTGGYGVYASNASGAFGWIAGNAGNGYATGAYGKGVDGAQGVIGECNGGAGYGIWGISDTGYAGYFSGSVHVGGALSKAGGSFKIDHPLDPANKYLSHSFVESPDMMNVYNGIITVKSDGTAVVVLPNWFQTLNRDFRYQLTALGRPGPNLYIAQEVASNQFQIGGGQPGMRVSWQVTGIRQDAWANAHRIPVEEMKPREDRGLFLHPVEHGQPESLGIDYSRRPNNIPVVLPPEKQKSNNP